MKRIEERGESKIYRRIVPKDVRVKIGAKQWLKTFKPGTPDSRIVHERDLLDRKHDALIERARKGEMIDSAAIAKAEGEARAWLSEPAAKRFEMLAILADWNLPKDGPFLNAMQNGGTYRPDTLTLEAVYAIDKEKHGGKRDEVSIERAINAFAPFVSGRDIRDIKRKDAEDYIVDMRKAKLSAATIRKRCGAVRAVLNRAFTSMEIEKANPFAKHKLGGGGSKRSRLPFHTSPLAKIKTYIARPTVQPRTRNIVRIIWGTGAALSEVSGLVVDDVMLEHAVPHIYVRDNAQRGLKKEDGRERRLPLLGDALEAAKDAVQRARVSAKGRAADKLPLFTGFNKKTRANAISASINNSLRTAGIPKSKRLTLYSLRHTMKEALRSANVPEHMQDRIMGHGGSGGDDVRKQYGSPSAMLTKTRDAMLSAVPHFGVVEESDYTAAELPRR